jgi:hypothetical protein
MELVRIEDIVKLIYPHHNYAMRCRGVVKQVHRDDIICFGSFWLRWLLIFEEWQIGKRIQHTGGLYRLCKFTSKVHACTRQNILNIAA